MTQKLQFKILKEKGNARVWEFTLNNKTVKTPVFMPVWTKWTVKWLTLDTLSSPKKLGTKNPANLILWNTYHLYLRPGDELIKKAWGLHKFINWNDGLILTDSWWFQVFSLGLGKKTKKWSSLVQIKENGVTFKSIHDWSTHVFTPSKVVDIQMNLGSDIMMMLDVCSPVTDISKETVAQQLKITHQRAKEAFEYHTKKYETSNGVLFPIVQGGLYKDLREASATYLKEFARDGIAIWGLSVGETKEEMKNTLQNTIPHLPKKKLRYLMWVWTPEDIRMAIYEWVDMFDCVLPTRIWRHWSAFTRKWLIKLSNSRFRQDFTAIEDDCLCSTCQQYSKAYIHHLFREKEMLWWILVSTHNIGYLQQTIEKIREDILSN